jgi:hypothetical protein
VCRGTRPTGDVTELIGELRDWVAEQLGAIAKPDDIRFADNLPKTRSGKIMRRLLRTIARDEEITQDITTLENPAIIEQLRGRTDAPVKKAPRPKGKAKSTAKAKAGARPKKTKRSRAAKPKHASSRASRKPRRKSPRRAK